MRKDFYWAGLENALRKLSHQNGKEEKKMNIVKNDKKVFLMI